MALDLVNEVDSKFWTKGRLETYTRWPFTAEDGSCTPERMAAAGFHFVGGDNEPDAVECFICGKQLDGWDATDDPWREHAKHQIKKVDEVVNNIKLQSQTMTKQIPKIYKHERKSRKGGK